MIFEEKRKEEKKKKGKKKRGQGASVKAGGR